MTSPTDLRRAADEIFERTSPYEGMGLRNHCLRIHRFAGMLLRRGRLALDDGLVYLAAMVHDLGLLSDRDPGANYLERTRALFRRETRELGIDPAAAAVVEECLLFNHRLRRPAGVSPEAECFRRAVWTEHSRGIVRHGLPRAEVRRVFAELPRDNFDVVLLDFTRRVVGREPLTLVRGIFF
jgi:hypothetical protein